MKQQFLVDIAGTFKAYIYQDNRKIVPTSATLTVDLPGSSTDLITAQAMGVAADGLLSYALTTTHNDLADANYKATIAYVFGGSTFYEVLFYDVVNAILSKVIVDDDILAELPSLRGLGWKVHGTADSGSTTTLVDAELKGRQDYPDDHFTGGTVESITQAEVRDITDFVALTGTLTTVAFSSAISTDKYIITRSYSREIQRAFEKIEQWVINLGRRPDLIIDPYDLRETHIYQTVAEICKGLITVNEELYWGLWKDYEKLALNSFKSVPYKYDESEDGIISENEEQRPVVRRTGRA